MDKLDFSIVRSTAAVPAAGFVINSLLDMVETMNRVYIDN